MFTRHPPKKRYLQQILADKTKLDQTTKPTEELCSLPGSHSIAIEALNHKLLDIENMHNRETDTYSKILCLVHKQKTDSIGNNNLLADQSSSHNQQTSPTPKLYEALDSKDCHSAAPVCFTRQELDSQSNGIQQDSSAIAINQQQHDMEHPVMTNGRQPVNGNWMGVPNSNYPWMNKAQVQAQHNPHPNGWSKGVSARSDPNRQHSYQAQTEDTASWGNGVQVKTELISDDDYCDNLGKGDQGQGYVSVVDKPGASGIIPALWNHLEGPIPKLPYVLCEDGTKKADYSGICQLLNMNPDPDTGPCDSAVPVSPEESVPCDTTQTEPHPGMSTWANERPKRRGPHPKTPVKDKVARLGDMVYYVTTSGRNKGSGKEASPKSPCQICGDVAGGFHCGAFVCEACKVSVYYSTLLINWVATLIMYLLT